MKVYISVDFEGVAGSTSWSSTNLGDLEHGPMAREMTLEAAAACRGALAAGATEIYIKDAHESGRNMIPMKDKRINGFPNKEKHALKPDALSGFSSSIGVSPNNTMAKTAITI